MRYPLRDTSTQDETLFFQLNSDNDKSISYIFSGMILYCPLTQGGGCDGAGRKITVDLGRGSSNATQIGHGYQSAPMIDQF